MKENTEAIGTAYLLEVEILLTGFPEENLAFAQEYGELIGKSIDLIWNIDRWSWENLRGWGIDDAEHQHPDEIVREIREKVWSAVRKYVVVNVCFHKLPPVDRFYPGGGTLDEDQFKRWLCAFEV